MSEKDTSKKVASTLTLCQMLEYSVHVLINSIQGAILMVRQWVLLSRGVVCLLLNPKFITVFSARSLH